MTDMKRMLILCTSALILAIGAFAAADSATPSTSDAEKAVAARSLAFVKAAVSGDLAGFRTFMADDYVMLWVEPASNGKNAYWATMTKEGWVQGLRSGKHKYHAVELLNTKVYLHGNVAIFAGDYTETGTREGVEYSDAGLFSETWVKRNGQWIIVSSVFP
jgi:ketosteroid isomerase-like protein